MDKKILVSIIALVVVAGGIGGYFYTKNQNDTVSIISSNNLGIKFPFELSDLQISDSLSTNQPIIIKPVQFHWPESINDSLLQDGWKLISTERANDGGSQFYSYYKSKDIPAMKLSYNWDLFKGEYTSLEIKFIPPVSTTPLAQTNTTITQPKDCGSSDSCFSDQVKTCTPAKATITNQTTASDQTITSTYIETIKGYEGDNCILNLVYTADPSPVFVGKEMTCKVPKSNLANFKDYLQGNNMKQACSGPLIDLLIQMGAK